VGESVIAPAYFEAVDDRQLIGLPLSVYLHLYHKVLDPVTFKPVKQLALKSHFGVSGRSIIRAMSLLVKAGYIERGPVKAAEVRLYRFVFSRGTAPPPPRRESPESMAHGRKLVAQAHAKSAKRRARKRSAPGNGITGADWAEIMGSTIGLCSYCNQRLPLSLDHVEPLSRGGAHDPSNAVPACFRCNTSKGDTPLVLWLARRCHANCGTYSLGSVRLEVA
jgi:5-methylcytosine-specific restriction endonuclease McrA